MSELCSGNIIKACALQKYMPLDYILIISADNNPVGSMPKRKEHKMDKKREKPETPEESIAKEMRVMNKSIRMAALRRSRFDPNGSYTGVCENLYDEPVQDADDL